MEVFVTFKYDLNKRSRFGITCNLKTAFLRYLNIYARSRTVGKEEGLFTCRAKHVFTRFCFVKFGERTAYSYRRSIYFLFYETARYFQIKMYRLSCAQFYVRSVYTSSNILRAYSPFYASSPFCPLRVHLVASSCVALSVTCLLKNYMWLLQLPDAKILKP